LTKEDDKKLKDLVNNSYKSVRVVGRGTVRIDPKEVAASEEFKKARKEVRDLTRKY
jgi:hypothetical protein